MIDRLRREREEAYARGKEYGKEWAEGASYCELDRAIREVEERGEEGLLWFDSEMGEESSAFKKGVIDGLNDVWKRVEEEEEE